MNLFKNGQRLIQSAQYTGGKKIANRIQEYQIYSAKMFYKN